MKRPTKPKLNKIDIRVLSEYEWIDLSFKDLIEKLSSLNIPFEDLYFEKEYEYRDETDVTIKQKASTEENIKKYAEKMEKYKKDMIAYHEYKVKQLRENNSCEEMEI